MLVIRREQLAVFDAVQLRRLEQLAAAHVCERFPARDAAELTELAGAAVHRAARHGISARPLVLRFAVLAATHGLRFDEEPWAADVLAEEGRSAADRLAIVEVLAGIPHERF